MIQFSLSVHEAKLLYRAGWFTMEDSDMTDFEKNEVGQTILRLADLIEAAESEMN